MVGISDNSQLLMSMRVNCCIPHTHTHTHSHTHTPTHSLTYTHTHTHTHAHTTHAHSLTHTQTHAHSRTHTPTHSLTHLHTHTHTASPQVLCLCVEREVFCQNHCLAAARDTRVKGIEMHAMILEKLFVLLHNLRLAHRQANSKAAVILLQKVQSRMCVCVFV